jgi:hypothetical protein
MLPAIYAESLVAVKAPLLSETRRTTPEVDENRHPH